ncbi:MAG TPA: hypothetical protein VF747_10225 [Blastocatellia bacterium]|jgi:hypothetical protein
MSRPVLEAIGMRLLHATSAATLVAFSCKACGHVWLELSSLIPGYGKPEQPDAHRHCSKCGAVDSSESGCFMLLKELKNV